jgi:hypothetical protein
MAHDPKPVSTRATTSRRRRRSQALAPAWRSGANSARSRCSGMRQPAAWVTANYRPAAAVTAGRRAGPHPRSAAAGGRSGQLHGAFDHLERRGSHRYRDWLADGLTQQLHQAVGDDVPVSTRRARQALRRWRRLGPRQQRMNIRPLQTGSPPLRPCDEAEASLHRPVLSRWTTCGRRHGRGARACLP